MNPESKIFVAGHRGLVGSALVRCLKLQGFDNIITRTHEELDLEDQSSVADFFVQNKPDYVFLAAAKVGGISANNTYPAEFIHTNLIIQNNVIHQSWKNGVQRLLFLGSSCIYPRDCPQPIKEEYLMSGPLEATNRPYSIAKIAGIESCWAYNRQYGTRFLAAMPTNLYGPGDNYDLENSHVLPALLRKTHDAKVANAPEIVAWGTGSPYREFLYSDDLADACIYLMQLPDHEFDRFLDAVDCPLINIGCGQDLSIRELLELICKTLEYNGSINWDTSKPDGTPKKLLNVDRLFSYGWRPKVSLQEGIRRAYTDFLSTYQ